MGQETGLCNSGNSFATTKFYQEYYPRIIETQGPCVVAHSSRVADPITQEDNSLSQMWRCYCLKATSAARELKKMQTNTSAQNTSSWAGKTVESGIKHKKGRDSVAAKRDAASPDIYSPFWRPFLVRSKKAFITAGKLRTKLIAARCQDARGSKQNRPLVSSSHNQRSNGSQ